MIFDTDILSMLGKIGRIDSLKKLFPESSLIISFEVYNELLRAKNAGYDFVGDISKQGFKVITLPSNGDPYNSNKNLREYLEDCHGKNHRRNKRPEKCLEKNI